MRSFLLVSLMVAGAFACKNGGGAPVAAAKSAAPPAAVPAVAKLSKVVFVDKEHACDCTRQRVEDTWKSLQAALGTPPKLPVERFHVDTQAAEVAAYTAAKPLMVPPGIYFVDAQQKVVELLQGEVTGAEISAVLAR